MKNWIIIAILYFLLGTSVFAQRNLLNEFVEISKDIRIKEDVLTEISAKTGLVFSYSQELPVWDTIQSLTNNNQSVKKLLIELFGEQIRWKFIKKKIVLKISNDVLRNKKFVHGQVLDVVTDKALNGATVRLKDSNLQIGTITDSEGRFNLEIKDSYVSDSIIISFLGYESYSFKFSLKSKKQVYKLLPLSIALKEVLVQWNDPNELLTRALTAIKDNYSKKPSIHRALYRESLKRNNKYMTYIEGLLDIYKCDYRSTFANDQAKILQLRKFTNLESTDTVLFKLSGGVDAILGLDLISKPLNFLSFAKLKNYKYYYKGIDSVDNVNAYKINFEPSIFNIDRDYRGSIYIDIESMAIIKVVFQLTKEIMKESGSYIVKKSKPRVKVSPLSVIYCVDYKKNGDKYYVSHISGDMLFKVKRRRRLLSSKYRMQFEMISTEVKTKDISKFKRKGRVAPLQILADIKKSYRSDEVNTERSIEMFLFPDNQFIKTLSDYRIEEIFFFN